MEHRRFSSIEQFKNIVKHVRDNAKYHGTPLPTLKFIGTVKIHGTQSTVAFDDSTWWAQSRERILTIESDNAGFCMFANRNIGVFQKIADNVRKLKDCSGAVICLEGEFFGSGIHKAVGVNQIEKSFALFSVAIHRGDTKENLKKDELISVAERSEVIHCIHDFKTYELEIDFANPVLSQNPIYDIVMEVERECPVAKALGATPEGGSMVGEGVVWLNDETRLLFKSKGLEHVKGAHKVHTVKEVSPAEIERLNSIAEFVETMVTETRLYQGIDKMKELSIPLENKSTGSYISYVAKDVMKEEKDVIIASGFDVKEVMPKVSEKVKNFWFKYLQDNT